MQNRFLFHSLLSVLVIGAPCCQTYADDTAGSALCVQPARVSDARDAYVYEVERAPYVKAGTIATAAALVGFFGYKFFFAGSSAPVLNNKELSEGLVRLQCAVEQLKKGQAVTLPPETWGHWLKSYALSIGSYAASSGVLALISGTFVTPAVSKIVEFKNTLPATGDLIWFVQQRTNFIQTIADLKSYTIGNFDRENFESVLPLFIESIEKILGYLTYRKEEASKDQSASPAKGFCFKRLEKIIENITSGANSIAAQAEQGNILELRSTLGRIEFEVQGAQYVVGMCS